MLKMTSACTPHFTWQLRTRALQLGQRVRVMGIVNVTPDSFSDGGLYLGTDHAVAHALRLLDEGADIVDLGGESTRPGAAAGTSDAISADEEQRRVLPVVQGVLRARPNAIVSIDTYRATTARAAVQAGAEIVNDVSGGLWDDAMLPLCAELACGVIVMHTRGLPTEWEIQPRLPDAEVVVFVRQALQQRLQTALAAGIARDRIVLDPGFGFGKRGPENWALLAGLHQFAELRMPLMVGLSRKGFLTGHSTAAADRDAQTHAANRDAIAAGAHLLRVHDVRGAIAAFSAASTAPQAMLEGEGKAKT